MAFNVAVFKTRSLTAAIFVLVMLAGRLWNSWSFFVLFSVIHFGCWIEYQHLITRIDPGYGQISRFHRYGVMLGGWCIMLYFAGNNCSIGSVSVHDIGLYGGVAFMFILPIAEIIGSRHLNLKNIAHSFFGLLYISLSWGLLTHLRNFHGGSLDVVDKILVLVIIGSIWINDTMAYIVGSLIGKTPLSSISPKKTWEGTCGGIILAVTTMGAIGFFANSEPDWPAIMQWMIIAAIASIAGVLGDLLESKLKRLANVKDSGHIMPGHGGFLDRFDSLLLATPFVWVYIMLFAR